MSAQNTLPPSQASYVSTNACSTYVVLARKWRPAQFADIVGQGHVVRTLMNAVRAQRIHQAYLFTGSRGIGKTSISRIFAKVIRCENTRMDDGWLRSCDECASCREIAAGTSIDVIEIDGASNNGVDSVREIRENAKYLPATGARKVYIIDEVHMLTTAAFNALLKTLEEPPAHVIFIFATTEPHKIPATILSRCQRFDYRRVTLAQIQQRLTEIAAAEKIHAEPGALSLIARAAEGSMRDALSLLDQVISFSGDPEHHAKGCNVTVASVRESVGLVESQSLLGILGGIFRRKPLEALSVVEQAYVRGHDLRVLTRGLIEFLHAAILLKVGAQGVGSGLLELSSEEIAELTGIASHRELEEIEMIFQVLHHGVEWIARSPQPKIVLDVLIVKCATAEVLVYVESATGTPASGNGETKPAPLAGSGAPGVKELPTRHDFASVAPQPEDPKGWESFIDHIRKTRPLLASVLENGSCVALPSEMNGSVLQIAFQPKDSYFRDQLQSRAYLDQLLAFAKEYFGKAARPQLEIREAGESVAERKRRELEEKKRIARESALSHPAIVEARSLFGGELGPIELTEHENGV